MAGTPHHERASLANAIKYGHPPEVVAAARGRLADAVAERALDDPVKLERAARIVRVALQRGKLTRASLLNPGTPGSG